MKTTFISLLSTIALGSSGHAAGSRILDVLLQEGYSAASIATEKDLLSRASGPVGIETLYNASTTGCAKAESVMTYLLAEKGKTAEWIIHLDYTSDHTSYQGDAAAISAAKAVNSAAARIRSAMTKRGRALGNFKLTLVPKLEDKWSGYRMGTVRNTIRPHLSSWIAIGRAPIGTDYWSPEGPRFFHGPPVKRNDCNSCTDAPSTSPTFSFSGYSNDGYVVYSAADGETQNTRRDLHPACCAVEWNLFKSRADQLIASNKSVSFWTHAMNGLPSSAVWYTRREINAFPASTLRMSKAFLGVR